MVLTKRPQRMLEIVSSFTPAELGHEAGMTMEDGDNWNDLVYNHVEEHGPIDPGIWLGTSVENQRAADARIPALLECPAKIRFVSFEPLLGAIALAQTPDWGIIGCESGHGRRHCDPLWMSLLVRKLRADGSKVFVKQVDMGAYVSHDPTEWPEALRRQEFPEVTP